MRRSKLTWKESHEALTHWQVLYHEGKPPPKKERPDLCGSGPDKQTESVYRDYTPSDASRGKASAVSSYLYQISTLIQVAAMFAAHPEWRGE